MYFLNGGGGGGGDSEVARVKPGNEARLGMRLGCSMGMRLG